MSLDDHPADFQSDDGLYLKRAMADGPLFGRKESRTFGAKPASRLNLGSPR